MRDTEEMIINDVKTPATSMLMSTVFLPKPPMEKQLPRIWGNL